MKAPRPTFENEEGQTIFYDTVRDAMTEQYYTMQLAGEGAQAVADAVNLGIDSHLEACFVPDLGDSFETKNHARGAQVIRKLHCRVSRDSLPVLLRRLFEAEGDLQEEACSLANDILGTLGLVED